MLSRFPRTEIFYPILVRGLANNDFKEDILSMMDQISLEDAITIVSKRELDVIEAANARMPTRTVCFRNTPGKSNRGPKVVTKGWLPDKAAPEQVKIETRPAEATRPGVHLAKSIMAMQPTNTCQHQQLDASNCVIQDPNYYAALSISCPFNQTFYLCSAF